MSTDLKIEGILIQVKDKLNQEHVKLWLPPYYTEERGSSDEEMQKLMKNYSSSLGIDPQSCLVALRELQEHALDRLRERDHFNVTGLATLKVRVTDKNTNRRVISLQTRLSATAAEFQRAVADEMGTEPERIKLIWNGKVLKLNSDLGSQGVRNGTQIMALKLQSNPRELQEFESSHKQLESTRADAKLLAERSNDDNYYLQVTDQAGNTLNLPPEEKKALIVAMSLHEKGRAALKKQDYALALVLLLEADKEFSHCQSQLLKSVDNYAVLNLDIAWCYLCLRSVTHIPDAEQRLKVCEQNFHQSYGPNLERLMALKGTVGTEAALFMRLHLLQAIVLFHQNKRQEARKLFERAEQELVALKVDDHSLSTLMELGYKTVEARLGLRATHGDVNAAVEYINKRRKERAEAKRRELAEIALNRERKRLGRCADGSRWVEPNFHKILMNMGYSSEAARLALQQSNNNVSLSVQIIQEHPSLLQLASTSKFKITNEMLQQVVAVGFDPRMAKIALKRHRGDIEKAVEELVAAGGIIDGERFTDDSDSDENEGSTSKKANEEKERQAYERLAEDMPVDEEDHLDLTLDLEESFLKEYQSLLSDR